MWIEDVNTCEETLRPNYMVKEKVKNMVSNMQLLSLPISEICKQCTIPDKRHQEIARKTDKGHSERTRRDFLYGQIDNRTQATPFQPIF